MLTKEENDILSRVGAGTPCGTMMRRYWHPIAAAAQLDANPVQAVRILCEDLILYRDRGGQLGLIGNRCLHRALDLSYGVPESDGLRCPYHGWLYDASGCVLETPLEPPVPSEAELRGGSVGGTANGQFYHANDHKQNEGGRTYLDDDVDRYAPERDFLLDLYRRAEELAIDIR